jgi:hypothetical protein
VSFVDDSSPNAADSSATAVATAVIVPTDAVQTEGDNGAVFVIDGHTVHRQAVLLGQKGSAGQTILSGLAPGATVAIGDFTKLHDGARIKITQ